MACQNLFETFAARRAFIALLALAFASGLPFAQASLPWNGGSIGCFGQAASSISQDYNGAIITVSMLMVALIAIAYMGGHAFEKQEWTFWAVVEGQNLLITVLLVLCVVAAFGAGCAIGAEISGGAGSPFIEANRFIMQLSDEQGLSLTKGLISDSMNDQMKAVSYIYWGVPIFGGRGMAYKANFRAIAQHRELLADLQMPLLVILQLQRIALMSINAVVIGTLLPAAVLFRSFFVTRDVGNFLIALCFGIYFVFPLTYSLAFGAYSAMPTPEQIASGGIFPIDGEYALGMSLIRVGYITPAAIIVPNLALVLTVSFTMAAQKALRGIGV